MSLKNKKQKERKRSKSLHKMVKRHKTSLKFEKKKCRIIYEFYAGFVLKAC